MSHEEFKTRLETELTSLVGDLNEIATQDENTGDWVAIPEAEDLKSADRNVEADAVEEWESRRAILSQLETRYRNTKRALNIIADGTYGTCEISGKEIEQERLEANPSARTNIENIARGAILPL